MKSMLNQDNHPRKALLEQISKESDLLVPQLADFKDLIRDRKIVTFYEVEQTRRLEQVSHHKFVRLAIINILLRIQKMALGPGRDHLLQPWMPIVRSCNSQSTWRSRSQSTLIIPQLLSLTARALWGMSMRLRTWRVSNGMHLT